MKLYMCSFTCVVLSVKIYLLMRSCLCMKCYLCSFYMCRFMYVKICACGFVCEDLCMLRCTLRYQYQVPSVTSCMYPSVLILSKFCSSVLCMVICVFLPNIWIPGPVINPCV